MNEEGRKLDNDKLRYDLYPVDAYEGCTKVLTFGAKKYAPNNWKLVNPKSRYYAALIRHLNAQIRHEEEGGTGLALDEETNLPHLDHAQCCLIFYRELSKNKPVEIQKLVGTNLINQYLLDINSTC
jgi:hypothetical protein